MRSHGRGYGSSDTGAGKTRQVRKKAYWAGLPLYRTAFIAPGYLQRTARSAENPRGAG